MFPTLGRVVESQRLILAGQGFSDTDLMHGRSHFSSSWGFHALLSVGTRGASALIEIPLSRPLCNAHRSSSGSTMGTPL